MSSWDSYNNLCLNHGDHILKGRSVNMLIPLQQLWSNFSVFSEFEMILCDNARVKNWVALEKFLIWEII